jgi:hypothetical protein
MDVEITVLVKYEDNPVPHKVRGIEKKLYTKITKDIINDNEVLIDYDCKYNTSLGFKIYINETKIYSSRDPCCHIFLNGEIDRQKINIKIGLDKKYLIVLKNIIVNTVSRCIYKGDTNYPDHVCVPDDEPYPEPNCFLSGTLKSISLEFSDKKERIYGFPTNYGKIHYSEFTPDQIKILDSGGIIFSLFEENGKLYMLDSSKDINGYYFEPPDGVDIYLDSYHEYLDKEPCYSIGPRLDNIKTDEQGKIVLSKLCKVFTKHGCNFDVGVYPSGSVDFYCDDKNYKKKFGRADEEKRIKYPVLAHSFYDWEQKTHIYLENILDVIEFFAK